MAMRAPGSSVVADTAGFEIRFSARRNVLPLRHPAQHQLVQPVGERRRIFRQLAVEDLRLLEQQERQIAGRILVAGDRRDQRMAHVDLEDRLGGGRLVLHRQQPLEHAVMRRRRRRPGMTRSPSAAARRARRRRARRARP